MAMDDNNNEAKENTKTTVISHVENIDLLSDLVTAKPKSCDLCILTEDDLKDGLRVLLRLDGLFHPGRLISVLPPDIYGVLVEKERGNKPHIMPREEVISEAVSVKICLEVEVFFVSFRSMTRGHVQYQN